MPIAQTRGSSLIQDINKVLISASSYVSEDDFWFRRLVAEAEKLKAASPHERLNVLAQLYGLAGNVQLAEQYIDAAIHSKYDLAVVQNKAVILSNLGYFSKAIPAFMQAGDPESGFFTRHWKLGLCIGAFQTLAKFLERAKQMQLDLTEVDGALISEAAEFLEAVKVTDVQLAHALDVAGDVLREHRLFFSGPGPEVSIWRDDPLEKHLSIVFKVAVPIAEAIALDEELGHKLFERCDDLPSEIMIHFESGMEPRERHADRPAVTG